MLTFLTGGYFGVGWTRDLWRIPEYVRDANNDVDYMKKLSDKMRTLDKPPFSVRVNQAKPNKKLYYCYSLTFQLFLSLSA